MNLGFAIAVTATLALTAPVSSQPKPAYRLVKTVQLGAPDRWDFVHFDPSQDRVYVSHASEITVVDGNSGVVLGRIPGIAGAHDVAIVPELGRGYADNGETGDVTVFDLGTLRPIGKIAADKDADAMIYDPATKRLVVGSGDARDASIIDVVGGRRIAIIPLGGTAESMALDGSGAAYINVDTANEIVRLNLLTNSIDARWRTPGFDAPHGLAIDVAARRLFASCVNSKMIVMDSNNGKRLALLQIGAGTDSAALDPGRKRAFSANKDGSLSVIAEQDSGRFASSDIKTAPGAKNMALDQRTGRFFWSRRKRRQCIPQRSEVARRTTTSSRAA